MTWTPTALDGVYQRFAGGEGDKFYAEKVQDVEPILERNKALRDHDDGWNESRDGRRLGSVPYIVIMQWLKEGFDPLGLVSGGGMNDPANVTELKRRLNSSDYQKLRTSEGVA